MFAPSKINLSHTLGPNGKCVRNWCETVFKIHEVDYIWVIHNYNICKAKISKGESLKSPVFKAATNEGCHWYLELSPNGIKKSTTNDCALFAKLDHTSIYKNVMVELKCSILDENQKEVKVLHEDPEKRLDKKSNSNWGFGSFIEHDYVLPTSDKLTIYCEIKFCVLDHAANALDKSNLAKFDPTVPELRLSNEFGQLFNDEESSDVVISVNHKKFKAHKLILSTRSSVFATMLKQKDMEESPENEIIITDFDEQIVEEMLKYIYTGMSRNLNKFADKLLIIAGKYELQGLKDMSMSSLVGNLSIGNAIDVLIFADFHEARKLKTDVIDFIVKKFTQMVKTTAWMNMVESHPHLVVEVCEAFSFS